MAPTGKRMGEGTRSAGVALPNSAGYLDGRLLIAMPVMGDPRFERSVIYLCAHSAEGAMGIIVNHPAGSIDFPELLQQLGIIKKVQLDEFDNPVRTIVGATLAHRFFGRTLDDLDPLRDPRVPGSDDLLRALGIAGRDQDT